MRSGLRTAMTIGLITTTTVVSVPQAVSAAADISGTVTDQFGDPIENVAIEVCRPSGCFGAIPTDGDGNFAVLSQPDDDYTLGFTPPTERHVREWWDDQPTEELATTLIIPTDTTTGLVVELAQNPILSGTVTDDVSGLPIENVSVRACRDAVGGITRCRGTTTDSNGDYSLQLERYVYKWVSFQDDDGAYRWEFHDDVTSQFDATPIDLTDGLDEVIDADLHQLSSISGTVTDESGTPLNFVQAIADPTGPGVAEIIRTDPSGNFTLYVEEGEYRVSFFNTGYQQEYWNDVTDPAAATLIDIAVRDDIVLSETVEMAELAYISGTITVDGTDPAVGATALLCSITCTGGSVESDNADSSGFYEMWAPPGDYLVRFVGSFQGWSDEFYDNVLTEGDATPVTLAVGSPATADANLTSGGTLSGTVTDVLDDPIDDVLVRFWDADGFVGSTRTNVDGDYSFDLAAGTYRVTFQQDGFIDTEVTDVEVATGGAATADVTMQRWGEVSGTVTDETTNDPIEGVFVSIDNGLPGGNRGGHTDENGHYSIMALPGADYLVSFVSGAHQDEFHDDVLDEADATLIDVGDGETVTIDATLSSGGVISGTVTNSAGDPLTTVTVRACTPALGCTSSGTDSKGDYVIGGLQSGEYTVEFADRAEVYASEFWDDQPIRTSADTINVVFGNVNSDIDAVLETGASLSGTVTGNGDPVEGIFVSACTATFACYDSTTDASGEYTIEQMSSGTFNVRFLPPTQLVWAAEAWSDGSGGRSVNVVEGSNTAGIDIDLRVAGSLVGVVTNADGVGLRDIEVTACSEIMGLCRAGLSGSGGVYTVTQLGPVDDYIIEFDGFRRPESWAVEYYCDVEDESLALSPTITSGEGLQIDASLRLIGDSDHDTCDQDDDGVFDPLDNCVDSPNADQADLNGDGEGDVCDNDDDGDNVPDTVDNCPTNSNGLQEDLDGDGAGDECDPTDDRDVFTPIVPTRFADSRNQPTFDNNFRNTGPRPGGSEWEIDIAGRGDVPLSATAIVINLTVLNAVGPGFATVHPCADELPNASSVNYGAGAVEPNEIIAKLSPDGTICVFTLTTADVIVDVVGALDDSPLVPLTPARYADSRDEDTFDGTSRDTGTRQGGSTWEIPVAGRGAVTASAAAAVVNLTVTGGVGPGFATVYPCGQLPNASSLNYDVGITRPNELIAKLSPTGSLCVYVLTDVEVILDVVGFLPDDAPGYTAMTPTRYADSRDQDTFDRQFRNTGQRPSDSTWTIAVGGRGDVPESATTVVANLTVTGATGPGFATVYDCSTRPDTSNINYGPGVTRPNELVVQLSPDGDLCVYTLTTVDVIVDIVGHNGM